VQTFCHSFRSSFYVSFCESLRLCPKKLVRNSSGALVLRFNPASKSLRLCGERPPAVSQAKTLLPGRRRLLWGDDFSESDSDEVESEKWTDPPRQPVRSSFLPVHQRTGLPKRSISPVVRPKKRRGPTAEDPTEDVVYVKTERVLLSQTFLTSWLVDKKSRV